MRCAPLLLVFVCWLLGTENGLLPAQDANVPATEVVIERVAVSLRDPGIYQVPLILSARKGMVVRSCAEGLISDVIVKTGEKVTALAELVRLDPRAVQLRFQRAQSEYQIAQLEEQSASGPAREIATHRLSIAKNNLDLAQLGLDQMAIKAPMNATVFRVYVTSGEFVVPGTPLMDIGDPSALVVEVPVDRNAVKTGDSLELWVEDRKVSGKVEAVLPAAERFVKLRDLFLSVASAQVVVENTTGAIAVGQAVSSPLIPRHPIQEVPNSALVNTNDGGRKVQVVRDGFVRDIPIVLLGPVGELYSFVSGRFAANDELVIRSSISLVDGTWLRPKLELLQQQTTQSEPASKSPPARKSTGGF